MPATKPQLQSELECIWPAGATLGEGTCWSPREQSLYWVDILEHKLYRYTPASGERREWRFDDTISAVAERASAPGLVVTLRRGYAFFDPESGTLQRLDEPEPERTANRFNDGKCDAQGRFWGGTMDFEGLMQAYLAVYGLRAQENRLPARTTVQVAGLPVPGALVEIEVVAARHATHP